MRNMNRVLAMAVILVFILMPGCRKEDLPQDDQLSGTKMRKPSAGFQENDMVMYWNEKTGIVLAAPMTPQAVSRYFAMVQIAVHDALNSIKPKYERYALLNTRDKDASPDAAVASAAYWVMKRTTFVGNPPIDQWYNESLASIPDGTSKELGISLGKRSADALIANRANDGFAQLIINAVSPSNGTDPGKYRSTVTAVNWVPTNTQFGFRTLPNWGTVMKPWVIESNQQFRPSGPYAVDSDEYTADFNEVKSKGARVGSTRNADEEKIAKFRSEDRASFLWNSIARKAVENKKLDAWKTARLFALLHVSMAESISSQLNAGYHFYSWRPETAIRLAETDGNDHTAGDITWLPFLSEQATTVTPRTPGYPNSYAAFGGTAAEILQLFFGSDETSIEITATSINPAVTGPRPSFHFSSFSQAARDNSLAMIYTGWDFRKSVMDGEEMGRQIARYVFNNQFREE